MLFRSLIRLFPWCSRSGYQPDAWKSASVAPIHKKKSRAKLSNCRPTSLLPIISKAMGHVAHKQMYRLPKGRELISDSQFGCRSGVGASDLLKPFQSEWTNFISDRGCARILAAGIAGAFDKVSHKGPPLKLRPLGIVGRARDWLASYLDGSHIRTVISGRTSSGYPITAGAPHGSTLGPTLFLAYVNDPTQWLPLGVEAGANADGATLHTLTAPGKSVADRFPAAADACKDLQEAADPLSKLGDI